MLGYIAGIIDGEGTISISSTMAKESVNPSHMLRVSVPNCDVRLIEWLMATLGGGTYDYRHRNERWRDSHVWKVHGSNAEVLLRALLPYLVLKREQAELAIKFRELTVPIAFVACTPLAL